MKLMGHSSVTVPQRYVHPSPESVERAFDRFEALNANVEKQAKEVQGGHKIGHTEEGNTRSS
jgi:hypothetical protein